MQPFRSLLCVIEQITIKESEIVRKEFTWGGQKIFERFAFLYFFMIVFFFFNILLPLPRPSERALKIPFSEMCERDVLHCLCIKDFGIFMYIDMHLHFF